MVSKEIVVPQQDAVQFVGQEIIGHTVTPQDVDGRDKPGHDD